MTPLRSSSFVGQAAEDRVKAVVDFGFTERQARFLVTVMQHSGVCLLRTPVAVSATRGCGRDPKSAGRVAFHCDAR
jgi:hypothetical protein